MKRHSALFAAALLASAGGTHHARAADQEQVSHGKEVFSTHCVLCHGFRADGNGKMAASLGDVRPANLRASKLSDAQKEKIIRFGGAGVGRSAKMPPWDKALSGDEIRDLLTFLRDVRNQTDAGG